MAENEKKDTKESKKEPETKQPDETTETTTEPTPDDINAAAEALIDESLIEEEPKTKQPDETAFEATVKEKMRPEIKTALVVLALTLLCTSYVYLIAFSDKASTSFDTFISVALAGVLCAFLGAIFLAPRDEIYIKLLCLFFLIFTIPAIAFIIPLSKYHNLNQIERDKKIVEILKITVLGDGIEILLPSKHISDNSYLEKVFSIGWERKNYPWKTTADYCQKGKEIWYEAELPFQGIFQKGKEIVLYFDHAWYDYEITKEISFPDPNHSL